MTNRIHSEMTAHKSRHFLLSIDFILPVLLLVAVTILFRLSDLDIKLQSIFYSPDSGWAYNSNSLAKFIYHYGNIPALLTCIGALLLFVLGYSKARFLPYRKACIYLVLAMIVGPGILVNSILKDNWGRPRPREITQFGGEHTYEAPLTYDSSSPGKSFPCGHATMGFYFFALAFILRKHRPGLARMVLLFAILWGGIIGWVRMGQGGHFASDVLWAGLLVYLSSFILFRAMSLQHEVLYQPSVAVNSSKLKLWHKLVLCLVGLLIILGVMLATPYSTTKEYAISPETGMKQLELKLDDADVEISFAQQTTFGYKADGFGFPGSKIRDKVTESPNNFTYQHKIKGFFTELGIRANLSLDSLSVSSSSVILGSGDVILKLPATFRDTLFISPRCEVQEALGTKVQISNTKPSAAKLWIDAPFLRVKKKTTGQ